MLGLVLALALMLISAILYSPTKANGATGDSYVPPVQRCKEGFKGYRHQTRNVRVPSKYIVNAMHLKTTVYYKVYRRANCHWQFEPIGSRDCWYVEYGIDPHVPANLGTFRRSAHNLYIRDNNEVQNPVTKYVPRQYQYEIQRVNCEVHNIADKRLEASQGAKWKVHVQAQIISYPDWGKWTRMKRFRVDAPVTKASSVMNWMDD